MRLYRAMETIAAFMHRCNTAYYAQTRIGADFTTAPEISQLFGEIVGLWLLDKWQQAGMQHAILLELGAGNGTLMADALRASRLALPIHIIETSPTLRARQASLLHEYQPIWHETLATLPDAPILLIANEFFDALPVVQLEYTPAGWQERCVAGRMPTTLHQYLSPILPPPTLGDVAELGLAGEAILAQLAPRLLAGLIIDYGYATPAYGDSLQALYQGKPCNPFQHHGLADLTCHVDFNRLATAAQPLHTQLSTQRQFLHDNGILQLLEKHSRTTTPAQQQALISGYHRLTRLDQMGELFKVLELWR